MTWVDDTCAVIGFYMRAGSSVIGSGNGSAETACRLLVCTLELPQFILSKSQQFSYIIDPGSWTSHETWDQKPLILGMYTNIMNFILEKTCSQQHSIILLCWQELLQ